MGRGILSGLIWGSLISILILGAVSLLSPLPEDVTTPGQAGETVAPLMESPEAEAIPEPAEDPAAATAAEPESAGPATSVDLPAGSEFRKALPETDAALPADADAPAGAQAPDVPAPVREAAARPGASAPRPETPGMSVAAPEAPDAETTSPDAAELSGTAGSRPAPDTASEPALPDVAGAETAPESQGFPPPIRTEGVETDGRATALGAADRLGGSTAEALDAGTNGARTAPSDADALAPSSAEGAERVAADESASATGTSEAGTNVPVEAAEAAADQDRLASAGNMADAERLAPEAAAPETAAAVETRNGAAGGETAPSPVPESVAAGTGTAETAPSAGSGESLRGTETTDAGADDSAAISDRAPEVTSSAPRPPTGLEQETADDEGADGGDDAEDDMAAQATEAAETAPPAEPVPDASQGGRFSQVVRPLTERTGGGSRLPQIGVDSADTEAAPEDSAAATAEAPEAASAAGAMALDALVRNARPFNNPEGKPLFSVILIYDGSSTLDREVLTTFTFPVTFAIDPLLPDAAAAAEEFARAGFEVVALATGLPEGATARDLETTLGAHLATLPQAVAVMDPEQDGVAGRRELAEQALLMAAQEGHGLIGWDRGVGTMEAAERRGDAPVALIYRPLDAEDEKRPVIGRYLDRAAFKAAQDGSVIMVGHARVETVSALFEWALGSKAGQVALAPVSAILKSR